MTPEPPDGAQLAALRAKGFSALYALDHEGADRAFSALVDAAPAKFEGYLFRAMARWARALFAHRRVSAASFASDEFYADSAGQLDAATRRALRHDLRRALELGAAHAERAPDDLQALYYLGVAYALNGAFEAATGSGLAGMRSASKAVTLHERVLARDPNYADAYLSIGMQQYIVGSLPLAGRLMASAAGFSGSKSKGIAAVERVARDGRLAGDDARSVLVGIYAREKRLEDALRTVRELRARHPANFAFGLDEASLLTQAGRHDEACAVLERLAADPRASAEARDLVEFSFGEALRRGGRHDRAVARFGRVWEWAEAHPDLATIARLRAGQCLDVLGRRDEAVAHYRAVLRRPDAHDAHANAGRFLKRPYAAEGPSGR